MRAIALIAFVVLAAASNAVAPATVHAQAQQNAAAPPAEQREPGLRPVRLYNGTGRPLLVEVISPRSFGTVALALIDHDGRAVRDPAIVHPGRVDLAERFADLWQIRHTVYVQVMDGAIPVGPALVLQPMLSRMVPVTETARRPNGAAYSRIVSWVEENQLPSPSPPPTSQQPATTAPDTPAESAQGGAEPSEPAEADSPQRVFAGFRAYVEVDVVLRTSLGEIRVALRPDHAPNTVFNFLELCRSGFYRDVPFHRIVPRTATGEPFVIQAGDPTGTGDGGPGYWLPIEDSRLPHDFGVISMARADHPDSAGSQFFFCLSRAGTARLDGQYCSFGYAVDGAATIKAIAEVELADVAAGRPVEPPLILDAELAPAPPRLPGRGRPDERVQPDVPATRPAPNRVPR